MTGVGVVHKTTTPKGKKEEKSTGRLLK